MFKKIFDQTHSSFTNKIEHYERILVTNLFSYLFYRTNASVEENSAEIINDSIAYLIASIVISTIQLVAGAACMICFNFAAISQATRMRIRYFTSLMRQDIGWYDLEAGESNFTIRLVEYGFQVIIFYNSIVALSSCFETYIIFFFLMCISRGMANTFHF